MKPLTSISMTLLAVLALLGPRPAAADDIVEVASGVSEFSTLVAAVDAAGLVSTLRGPGPFTVFAPTDAAFASLPAGTLDKLLADTALLGELLTYHVVAGQVMAAEVVTLREATTAQGENVRIRVDDGTVRINNANVIRTDVMADNGVIHVIDRVIMPKGFIGRLNRN